MPKRDETDDLDQLIDVAVDTFFVEAPTSGEHRVATDNVSPGPSPSSSAGTAVGSDLRNPFPRRGGRHSVHDGIQGVTAICHLGRSGNRLGNRPGRGYPFCRAT